jgi:hypothetical protein
MRAPTRQSFGIKSELGNTSKFWALLLGMWIFLSISQTLHFYFYYEQSFWNSVRWSTRDWFVWFVIFAGVYKLCSRHKTLFHFNTQSILTVAAIAVGSGLLQTFSIVSLDFIAGTANRPFWQDFSHFYNKRWLQHLFIFSIFWLSMLNQSRLRNQMKETSSPSLLKDINKIKVNDGKHTHWLKPEDIYHIEAAGNYICFHTTRGQLIERATLKQTLLKLDTNQFVRVNRSNIVNLQAINTRSRISRTKIELTLTDGSIVTIGPTYWDKLKVIAE